MFGMLKRAARAATTEVKADYAENKDFLEAVCAGVALVAAADGEIEDSERAKAMKVVSGHTALSKL
jgi:tellurite resistance protein